MLEVIDYIITCYYYIHNQVIDVVFVLDYERCGFSLPYSQVHLPCYPRSNRGKNPLRIYRGLSYPEGLSLLNTDN